MNIKYWKGVLFEGACCGFIAGFLYFLFSGLTNFLAFPLGSAYGSIIGLFIGVLIK